MTCFRWARCARWLARCAAPHAIPRRVRWMGNDGFVDATDFVEVTCVHRPTVSRATTGRKPRIRAIRWTFPGRASPARSRAHAHRRQVGQSHRDRPGRGHRPHRGRGQLRAAVGRAAVPAQGNPDRAGRAAVAARLPARPPLARGQRPVRARVAPATPRRIPDRAVGRHGTHVGPRLSRVDPGHVRARLKRARLAESGPGAGSALRRPVAAGRLPAHGATPSAGTIRG